MIFSATSAFNPDYTLILQADETATDAEANTSTVTWKLILTGKNGTYARGILPIDYSVRIGDVTRARAGWFVIMPAPTYGVSTVTVAEGTETVTHDVYGDAVPVCSARISTATAYKTNPGTVEIQPGVLPLTAFPRSSSVRFPSGMEIGSAQTLTIDARDPAFRHVLTWTVGSQGGTIGTNLAPGTVSWTPPASVANLIPDKTSVEGSFGIITKNGSTVVATASVPFILYVPSSYVPTITVAIAPKLPTAGFRPTNPLAGYSEFTLTVNPTLAGGSPIRRLSVLRVASDGGNAYFDVDQTGSFTQDLPPYATAGSLPHSITVRVTDARGRTSTTQTVSVTVDPYHKPIPTLRAYRCTAAGAEDANGEHMRAELTVEIQAVSGALGTANQAYHRLRFKTSDDIEWTELDPATGPTYTSPVFDLPLDFTADWEAEVADEFTETTGTWPAVVPKAFVLMDFNASGKGVSFGRISEGDTFDVDMPLGVHLLNRIYPVNAIYLSAENKSPATLIGGSWQTVTAPSGMYAWKRTS